MTCRTVKSLARMLEPELQGKIERLGWYLEKFRAVTPDTRVLACQLEVAPGDPPVITGYVSLPRQRSGLLKMLEILNLGQLEAEIAVLEDHGQSRFLLAQGRNQFLYTHPRGRSAETQLIEHEPVRAFALQREGRILVQNSNGYLGWAETRGFEEVDEAGWVLALPQVSKDLAARALDQARKLLGLPYAWGGLGPEGVDCSGLTQTAWRAAGILLPRDSDQQLLCGALTATPQFLGGLGPGDLLFFSGEVGRITHVAIHVADGRFIEATVPVARAASLNPTHEDFVPRLRHCLAYAKRMTGTGQN